MRTKEPGSYDPVEHFLGRSESPFVIIAGKTEELGDLGVRGCQANIRWIGDVSVTVKKLEI